jgi:hypothetical protein
MLPCCCGCCLQVPWAHATFSTKERSRCAIVEELAPAAAAGADADEANSSSSQRRVFLAEPVAFYKLESGGSKSFILWLSVFSGACTSCMPLAPTAAAAPAAGADKTSSQRRVLLVEPVASYKLESGGLM